jgi:ABC-2 type transport system permease protein
MPRREGSPWTGLWTVFAKETADHLTSSRIWVIEGLVLLIAGGTIYAAIGTIKDTVGQDPFLYLSLFTTAREGFPPLLVVLSILVPIVSIALGFDAVNIEHTRRTMSRILAQPIYRDALLFGKFLAGLATLSICFLTLWLLVIGLGLVMLGLPPGGEEVVRGFAFIAILIAYGAVWLALSILFSTIFRQPATSALGALALWLMFAFVWPSMVAPLVTDIWSGPAYTQVQAFDRAETQAAISRVAPNVLFSEATIAILSPGTNTLSPVMSLLMRFQQGAVLGAPLPFEESLLLVWPQITGLIAPVILLFALTYVLFQRQEIRA